jgi:L-threonylcarbamoyladenylate synthase
MKRIVKGSLLTNDIETASSIIRSGGVVLYPTETVYGLGADAGNIDAVMRISSLKKRDPKQPISIAVSSIRMLNSVAYLDNASKHFINRFLPGPITVIVTRKPHIPDILTGGTDLIGIRWPDQTHTIQLIESVGRPITSTSANTSGNTAPAKLEEVEKEILLKVDYILDGGDCGYGEPSTIVDLVNRKILRKGALIDYIILALEEME